MEPRDGWSILASLKEHDATSHIPVVKELLLRGVLQPPALRPKFLDDPEVAARLAAITPETTALDLLSLCEPSMND